MPAVIRAATPQDAGTVHRLILALSDYEQLAHEVRSTAADIEAALFGDRPAAFCDLAEVDGEVVGFALWYYSFSTFVGRRGIYLEDLFVEPKARGLGVGAALLAHLARRTIEEGLERFEWEVLDWNQPAIDFYEAQGAVLNRGWIPVRLSGEALARLAGRAA